MSLWCVYGEDDGHVSQLQASNHLENREVMFDQVCVCRSQLLYGFGDTAVTLHWPHLQYCRHKMFGSRSSSLWAAAVTEPGVLRVVTTRCVAGSTMSETLVNYPQLPFSFPNWSTSTATTCWVGFQCIPCREGHQFSVQTYNKLLLSWATQVNCRFDLVFSWPLPFTLYISDSSAVVNKVTDSRQRCCSKTWWKMRYF